LSVLLLFTVSVRVPLGVLAVVFTLRMEVPEPPNIVDELKIAPIPTELAPAGITTASCTGVLNPALGAIVTLTD
jgi:hypothetical protein